jgi:hypothetical protein
MQLLFFCLQVRQESTDIFGWNIFVYANNLSLNFTGNNGKAYEIIFL